MRILLFLTTFLAAYAADGSWKVQYFYDRDDSKFVINDFQFLTEKRGVAAGFKESKKDPLRPLIILTGDGGKTWVESYPPGIPETVFFISDTTGWMSTDSGVWQTLDATRSWRKQAEIKGILRLWFMSEKRGYVIGANKLMKETKDGGETWTDVKAAQDVTGRPSQTRYTAFAFNGRSGIVAGVSEPSRQAAESPAWVDPREAASRRLWPTLSIGIRTIDGGDTWIAQTAPVFGTTVRMKINGNVGLSVVRYGESFEVPSELYAINTTGKVQSAFKQKNRVVTDAGWLGAETIIVAVEPPGKLNQLPFPGKVKVLKSLDLTTWTEMDISYKAFGGNAMLSIVSESDAWIATDTGMILHFVPAR